MTADVVVIGLDAAEATLLERWAADGDLPTIARLTREGAVARLTNSLETLPGSIWPELSTGISGGRLGLFYHPQQLHTGESRTRPVEPDDVDVDRYYWVIASRAGRRVAVVDVPQVVLSDDLDGIHVTEWGLHDRNFSIASHPPQLIDDLRDRHGDHPVPSCDAFHGKTTEGYLALRDALLAGAAHKREMLVELLEQEHWNLFTCAFGESHCVGHQLWHFMDKTHPRHPDEPPAPLRDAIHDVYGALDRGIGAIVDAAGPDATVLVVASHGMGQKIGGPQLLPEVLVRLGLGSDAGLRLRLRRLIPRRIRGLVGENLPKPLLDRTGVTVGSRSRSIDSPAVKAITVKNNRCGAIRLNLAGREPFGSVRPGADAEALVSRIRSELLALRHPDNGEPIVQRVVTAGEAFGPDHHPDVPDIMVVFRGDLGPLEACTSGAVGRIDEAVMTPSLPRTGDHHPESRLWMLGPAVPRGVALPDADVLDVAPTVLDLLGVAGGRPLDGHSLLPAIERAE
jgi:predicted AlkP superfamily phosphohydrolase/phosphomutase